MIGEWDYKTKTFIHGRKTDWVTTQNRVIGERKDCTHIVESRIIFDTVVIDNTNFNTDSDLYSFHFDTRIGEERMDLMRNNKILSYACKVKNENAWWVYSYPFKNFDKNSYACLVFDKQSAIKMLDVAYDKPR